MKTPGAERGRAGVPLLAVRMQEQEITSTKAIVRERLTMKFTAALLALAVSYNIFISHKTNDNLNDDTYRYDTI